MLEMPSPNVTHILPLYMSNLPDQKRYNITSHGRGVFEFNPVETKNDVITTIIESAFYKYEQNDAVYPVTITGLKTCDSPETADVGSTRFCTMDKDFAQYLTNVISGRSVVDIIKDGEYWHQMINVSQYFRFMRYQTGGEHFPHYDSDFVYQYNNAATKYSLVVYFNDCDSGELAFVDDAKRQKKCIDHTDWKKQANDSEIWLKIKPSCMKIVLFPHTLCHAVLPFTDENNVRYICRGDILFEKV
jgi:hypothetical protein